MEYAYSFAVRPRVLPPDWRDTMASPTLAAVHQLFMHMDRVNIEFTEAEFNRFRSDLKDAGYDLEGILRTLEPVWQGPEPVE